MSAAAITSAIRTYFAEGRVPVEAYRDLIDTMPGNDPDDRQHMAGAVVGRATVIVTWNLTDFPTTDLAAHGIRVMDPDGYLCDLIVDRRTEVVATVVRMAAEKRKPAMTAHQMAAAFARAGTRYFAARLSDRLDARLRGEPDDGNFVAAARVGAYCTAHRPPRTHDIELVVPPHQAVGEASHALVIKTLLMEMLNAWPNGTTLVISYDEQAYTQVLTYPPSIQTEIGRLSPLQMDAAVRFGWIDPSAVTKGATDFESRPVWERNPLREWMHPFDKPADVADFLSASVRTILAKDPADGYTIKLFNVHVGNT
ncbi:hypothetical protein AB0J74_09345 [Asanoa sp. NPDC049573]|uniref:hypothetical protein n=1 Tax=Asanoa sp. NPDC049573 TaxID=3155396 RepID=UPI00344140E4